MFTWRKKLRNIILIITLIIMLCFLGVNCNGQQGGNTNVFEPEETNIKEKTSSREEIPTEVIVEPEQKQTNLTVMLIDNINGSNIRLRNCILQLVGEMQIAEDMFTYNNTFYDGNIYKITVLVELKEDTEQK